MIRRIDSNLKSFKPLNFGPGLNILLADKNKGSTDKQSRNGAGKTSFVELVHFLFGGDTDKESIFRSEALKNWTFNVSIDVGGRTISTARKGERRDRISIEGDIKDWPVAPSLFATEKTVLSNKKWKEILGSLWFKLPDDNGTQKFKPTFRSLFSAVARRQAKGGFQHPMKYYEKQQSWNQQVTISYLIGLDWTIPGRFEELRIQENKAKGLLGTVHSGEFDSYFGKVAELRTWLTVSDNRAQHLRKQIDNFRVVPEYRELEREASEITGKINDLNVENIVDHDLIRELQASLESEDAPNFQDLTKIYHEAGIVLPDLPRRRLEDVERFHRTVIENRRSHLGAEITSAEQRIAERGHRKEQLDDRRAQIMGLLKSGGALEHYTGLREELGRVEAKTEMLRQRLELTERLESRKTELDMERNRLVQRLRNDIRERERDGIVREAILIFEELSQSLYERHGILTISDTKSGPEFDTRIESERSKGITNMQIFCFDLMLTELGTRHGRWPGFLIHDSHLFDGVDERQVAKALQLGAERAEAGGFQYIVTMNSDAVPREGFRAGFDPYEYVIEPRLTDATETGGLFGLRFN